MKFTATFAAAVLVAAFRTVASVTAINVTCRIPVPIFGSSVPVSGTIDGPGVDSICGGVIERLDGISFGGSLGALVVGELAPSITIARGNDCPQAGSITCTTACSDGQLHSVALPVLTKKGIYLRDVAGNYLP